MNDKQKEVMKKNSQKVSTSKKVLDIAMSYLDLAIWVALVYGAYLVGHSRGAALPLSYFQESCCDLIKQGAIFCLG